MEFQAFVKNWAMSVQRLLKKVEIPLTMLGIRVPRRVPPRFVTPSMTPETQPVNPFTSPSITPEKILEIPEPKVAKDFLTNSKSPVNTPFKNCANPVNISTTPVIAVTTPSSTPTRPLNSPIKELPTTVITTSPMKFMRLPIVDFRPFQKPSTQPSFSPNWFSLSLSACKRSPTFNFPKVFATADLMSFHLSMRTLRVAMTTTKIATAGAATLATSPSTDRNPFTPPPAALNCKATPATQLASFERIAWPAPELAKTANPSFSAATAVVTFFPIFQPANAAPIARAITKSGFSLSLISSTRVSTASPRKS